jgi:hypothetical protein
MLEREIHPVVQEIPCCRGFGVSWVQRDAAGVWGVPRFPLSAPKNGGTRGLKATTEMRPTRTEWTVGAGYSLPNLKVAAGFVSLYPPYGGACSPSGRAEG